MLPDDKTPKQLNQGLLPSIISPNKDYKSTLELQKYTLIGYLKMKTEEQDWHGVADAAMDLRELEVKIALTKS